MDNRFPIAYCGFNGQGFIEPPRRDSLARANENRSLG